MSSKSQSTEASVLWQPSDEWIESTRMVDYLRWLERNRKLEFTAYSELFSWSVDDLEAFWISICDYFELDLAGSLDPVLSSREMPGAHWFSNIRINYAEQALRTGDQACAVIYRDECGARLELTYSELRARVGKARTGLKILGVKRGDRVVGYLPNCPEALVSLLAVASLGAVWSSCPPEFGVDSVLERFQQIEPKILIATDAYTYGGKRFERGSDLEAIVSGLPTLEQTVVLPRSTNQLSLLRSLTWDDLLASDEPLTFDRVPFEHPLWILYSSGTTGIPKAIVHGHGGIVLENLKQLAFHGDIKPGDRFFWYSTTGWMMWNYLVSGLLVGATVVLYEGSPAHPDLSCLFQLAAEEKVSYLGTSAPFIMACRKAGLSPKSRFDLSKLRTLGSTGAPLPEEGFEWVYEEVKEDLLLASVSGGTDVCTAFVGSCPILPVRAGEIQCACLGTDVAAFDDQGRAVLDQVGELVIRQPMPSMPIFFWGDPDGKRYKSSYFENFEGVWCHGDWVKIDAQGRSVIYGRSDSTLNRGGVRMGTSEFYRAIDAIPEVLDSLVVETSRLGRDGKLWLFIVLDQERSLDGDLEEKIRALLRTRLSPRHAPDEIRQIAAVPTTLSGKKLEVPIKRILTGTPLAEAVNQGTLRNPEALEALLATASG